MRRLPLRFLFAFCLACCAVFTGVSSLSLYAIDKPVRVGFSDCTDPYPPPSLIPPAKSFPPHATPPDAGDCPGAGWWFLAQTFTKRACDGGAGHAGLLDPWTSDVFLVECDGSRIFADFIDPDDFTSHLEGQVIDATVNFTITGFAANPGIGPSATSYSGTLSNGVISGTLSGSGADGANRFGEPDSCGWSGVFKAFVADSLPDPATVEGALARGVFRLREQSALAEGRMLARLEEAKTEFEAVRWLREFHDVRATAEADLKEIAADARLSLLLVKAESIDDARTADPAFALGYQDERRLFLEWYRVAGEQVDAALHEAVRLLFCAKPGPPPEPQEKCEYVLIVTNMDAADRATMKGTTDKLVEERLKHHQEKKDGCDKIVRVEITKTDVPVPVTETRNVANLEAAHAAFQAAIDMAVGVAVADGRISAGAKACEIHTIGHGTGDSIIFGDLHYTLVPDVPDLGAGNPIPKDALFIDRFAELMKRYLCCDGGHVFLWHCYLGSDAVGVHAAAQTLLGQMQTARADAATAVETAESAIAKTEDAIAALAGKIDKDSVRERRKLERRLEGEKRELAEKQAVLAALDANIATVATAVNGPDLKNEVGRRIDNLREAIKQVEEDIVDVREAIDNTNKELAGLAKDLKNRTITREEYESEKKEFEDLLASNRKILWSNVDKFALYVGLIVRWNLMNRPFGAALAERLVEDCPKQRVTAVDGVVEWSSAKPPGPFKSKDVPGKEAQEVTFPRGEGSGSEDKK
ncbi:MAG: hypothetical protein HY719_16860 [Planctomycetes bacterium]|nr:hypothetical protein [Planctomycetota bacterium]